MWNRNQPLRNENSRTTTEIYLSRAGRQELFLPWNDHLFIAQVLCPGEILLFSSCLPGTITVLD